MKFGDKIRLKKKKFNPKSNSNSTILLWTMKDQNIKCSLAYKDFDAIYIGIYENNPEWLVIWNIEKSLLQIVSPYHL